MQTNLLPVACKFEVFSADTVFENTATKEKRLIYHVQRSLQCLQQACTNLVSTRNIEQVHTAGRIELLFDNIFIAW